MSCGAESPKTKPPLCQRFDQEVPIAAKHQVLLFSGHPLFFIAVCSVSFIVLCGIIGHLEPLRKEWRSTETGVASHLKTSRAKDQRPEGFRCGDCGKYFSWRQSLYQHRRECGKEPQFECSFCGHRTKRRRNLRAHILRVHPRT